MPHGHRPPNFTNRAQCRAHSKRKFNPDGTPARCTKQAIEGGFVCRHHGGNAPHVMAAAERRLRQMVAPMIAKLYELAMQTDDLNVASQCVRDALNRAGIGELVQAKVRASKRDQADTVPRFVVNIGFLQKPELPAIEPAPLALEAAVLEDDDKEPA